MRIKLQYISILLLFWSCNSPKQATNSALDEKTKLVISYSQISGLTQETPEYTLELYSNRQMYLTAIKNIDKQGKFMRTLSENEFNQVIDAFNSSKFFKFDDEYTSTVPDLPTRYLYFSHNGNEKKVKDYQNAPEKLTELEFLMQSFLDRVGWEKMVW